MILGLLTLGVAAQLDATPVVALSGRTATSQGSGGGGVFLPPSNLTASAATDTIVNLAWSDNATNESGYNVERSLSPTSGLVKIAKTRSNVTSYRSTGLSPATTYYYRVQALRKGYPASDYSNVASVMTQGNDLQPPSVPTGLVADVAGCKQIDITWASSTDTGTGLAGYQIYRDGSVVGSTPGNSFSDSGLAPLSPHSYNLVAYDNAGNYSPMSVPVSATTTACSIANQPPVAHAGPDQTAETLTTLTFDASGSSDTDGTIVSYSWTFGDGATASGAVVTHAFADAGTYTVGLTVTDDLGATASDGAIATILNRAPLPSAGPDQTATAGAVVTFNGSNSRDLDGVIVGYSWNFGDGWTGTGVTTTHIFTTNGTYNVTLTVTDDLGGTASDTAIVTINPSATAPSAPVGLTATATSSSQIDLTWTAGSTNETGFKVERGPTAAGPFSQIAATTAPAYSDTGLSPATTYFYRVRATNAQGDSPYSGTASAATFQSVPAAPTALAAAAASASQINLSWTDNSTNETGFKVERASAAAGPFTQIATTTAASFSDSGLSEATTYYYRVRATNAAGDSAYSNTASATTRVTLPAAPSALTAAAASASSISLAWTDNSLNETGFKVERATAAAGPFTQIATTTSASFSDSGLSEATTYYYRVCATNAAGDSAYSNTASATTSLTIPAAPTGLVATAASASQINLSLDRQLLQRDRLQGRARHRGRPVRSPRSPLPSRASPATRIPASPRRPPTTTASAPPTPPAIPPTRTPPARLLPSPSRRRRPPSRRRQPPRARSTSRGPTTPRTRPASRSSAPPRLPAHSPRSPSPSRAPRATRIPASLPRPPTTTASAPPTAPATPPTPIPPARPPP